MASEEQIRKEAKQLLDKFAKELDKVKISDKSEKKEVGGFREEGKSFGKSNDGEFRKAMFKNAPNTKDDCIVAEKKSW